MPTLYLLSVGINKYAGNVNSLSGCVNDAEAYEDYFREVATLRKWNFRAVALHNEKATRRGLISAFSLFEQAGRDDFCVWTFSGHGSRCPAPPQFWHQAADQEHRSIVCHDSRAEGGSDLLDKELSWLIWRATQRETPFLAITDCCFSGQNLRYSQEANRGARFDQRSGAKPLEDYLGIEDYRGGNNASLNPPRGSYLQLAASHRNQPALERAFGQAAHGLFTHKLLQELKSLTRPVTYRELYYRVKAAVSISCQRQAPQLDVYEGFSEQSVFLLGEAGIYEQLHWLYFNREKMQWRVNAGSTAGLTTNTPLSLSIDNAKTLVVKLARVYPFYGIITNVEDLEYHRIYPVNLSAVLPAGMTVACAPDFPANLLDPVKNSLEVSPPPYVAWSDDPKDADYWIDYTARDDSEALELVPRSETRAVFPPVPLKKIDVLQEKIGRIGTWWFVKKFSNPSTYLTTDSVSFDLKVLVEGKRPMTVDWDQPVTLKYNPEAYDGEEPAYSLKITNTSNRLLYISALFLSNTYAITNSLLESESLKPGEYTNLKLESGDYQTTEILNHIEDFLWEYGVVENIEFLQILIATVPLDTRQFNQSGLKPFADKKVVRSPSSRRRNPPDWTTFPIQLRTLRPLSAKPLVGGRSATWFDHVLTPPAGFSASSNFYPVSYLEELLGKKAADKITFLPVPYLWTPGYNLAPGLCLFELTNILGQVTQTHPLEIQLPHAQPSLRACGYDSDLNTFVKLPSAQESDRKLLVHGINFKTSNNGYRGALILLTNQVEGNE